MCAIPINHTSWALHEHRNTMFLFEDFRFGETMILSFDVGMVLGAATIPAQNIYIFVKTVFFFFLFKLMIFGTRFISLHIPKWPIIYLWTPQMCANLEWIKSMNWKNYSFQWKLSIIYMAESVEFRRMQLFTAIKIYFIALLFLFVLIFDCLQNLFEILSNILCFCSLRPIFINLFAVFFITFSQQFK